MKTKKANPGDMIRVKKFGLENIFLVEDARMEGGQTGTLFNNYDSYPDGWHVKARKLNGNRTYNPDGRIINFYQSGCFTDLVEEVEVVGKMQQYWKEVKTR